MSSPLAKFSCSTPRSTISRREHSNTHRDSFTLWERTQAQDSPPQAPSGAPQVNGTRHEGRPTVAAQHEKAESASTVVSDPWKPLANAFPAMPFDQFVALLQENWDIAEAVRRDASVEWRARHGKDYRRWRPKVGDSIEVLCTGAYYGIDANGIKWRLPKARDIVSSFKGMKGAWFKLTFIQEERGKENTPYYTPNAPSDKTPPIKRPHRKTGRKSSGRPARLRFTVEHIVGPALQWTVPANEGHRDLTVYRFVRKLHEERFSEDQALEQALDLARRCNPPFDEEEVRRKVERVFHPQPMTTEVETRMEAQRMAKRTSREPVEVAFRDVAPLEDCVTLAEAEEASEVLGRVSEWILATFRGRRDRYAFYFFDKEGRVHPSPTKRTGLTPAVIVDHLTGSPKGVYLVELDGTVSLVVFDVDAHVRSKECALDEVRAICRELVTRGAEYERNFIVEDSGNGYHVWVFVEPLPSVHAGTWGTRLLNSIGLKPDSQFRSVIPPATGGLGPKGLGPLVRLPLGVHPKSGLRSRFLDAEEVAA